jgi:RimJ/RimL family protein N-acetyltransferase
MTFIKKNELFLKEAISEDAELLFDWANEISVRNNSIDQNPIIWENHLKWFNEKITNTNTKIFILTNSLEKLGQIRIDLIDSHWFIDYSISKQYRGNGLGKDIIRLVLNKFKTYKFKATVKKQNIASLTIFIHLGFKKIELESNDFDYFEYNIQK